MMRMAVCRGGRRLSELRPGYFGSIAAVEPPDTAGYRRLTALGLVPGVEIRLIRTSPAYILRVGRATIALDRETARGIRVWVGAAARAGPDPFRKATAGAWDAGRRRTRRR